MPEPTHYAPKPTVMRGDPTMRADVDIMGVQRGAHKDGPDVCPQFVFKVPGGTNEDGTKLWGWNDVSGAYCKNCKCRDTDHVLIRDFTTEALERDRKKDGEEMMKKANPPPAPEPPARATGGDATAHNPSAALSRSTYVDPAASMQVFELEPGVPDPLAINAYRDAERERDAKLAKQTAAEQQRRAASQAAQAARDEVTRASAADDENARFKAEVERMVREQLAKERSDRVEALSAPATAADGGEMSVSAMLTSLGLDRYIPAFEEEGMEMAVLVQLAQVHRSPATTSTSLTPLAPPCVDTPLISLCLYVHAIVSASCCVTAVGGWQARC